MVCDKCEKKLAKVICPDKWKDGARNTTEGGGRKLNENKLLGKGKNNRYSPYAGAKCKICKSNVHQQGGTYCQACAYSKGLCALCGKMIMDTKDHKQSQA
jgi:hypothetical protein